MTLRWEKPTRTDTPTPRTHPYLDWLRMQPCHACGKLGSEAAHVRASISPKTGLLMPRRKKHAMLTAIPLCPTCHRTGPDSIHALGEATWEAKYVQPWTLAHLALAYLARWAMLAIR